jgi:hypothetical protein
MERIGNLAVLLSCCRMAKDSWGASVEVIAEDLQALGCCGVYDDADLVYISERGQLPGEYITNPDDALPT